MFSLSCLNSPFTCANGKYCNVSVKTYLQSSNSSQMKLGLLYLTLARIL